MERKEASGISTGVLVLLTFTGLVEGTVNNSCRELPCDKTSFDAAVYEYCVLEFNRTMATTGYQLKCPWPTARHLSHVGCFTDPTHLIQLIRSGKKELQDWFEKHRHYVNLTICMEWLGNLTCCTQVSFQHRILLEIHQVYFSLCSRLKDPDLHILLLLIFPCIIITFITPLLFHKFRLYEQKKQKDNY